MATAALILYLVWMTLAFGARTFIAIRRTGDSGWRGIRRGGSTLELAAGALFAVALVLGAGAPVAALLGLDPLVGSRGVEWIEWIGVAVAVAGGALTVAAQMAMGDSWRIGVDESERTALVTSGLFARTRNPIFSAMLLASIGLALMVPNVIALAAVVALVVALELQVRLVEEPYLLATHGPRYADYARGVGRFVPGLGRLVRG
jgi:protein-S-isoprenylcysteine O-methyltransferase Ste14